jgi:hypothetical protein
MGQRLSEQRPILTLLQQHDGLIVLGDPGSGKTTFLKYLALRLAAGEGADLLLGERLPVLIPLSACAKALVGRDALFTASSPGTIAASLGQVWASARCSSEHSPTVRRSFCWMASTRSRS